MGKKIEEAKKLKKETEARKKELEKRIVNIEKRQTEYDKKSMDFLTSGGGPDILTSKSRVGSYESKILNSFGCKSLPDLLKTNVAHQRYGHVDVGTKSAVLELKETMDIGRYIAQIFYDNPLDKGEVVNPVHVRGILDTYYGKNVLAPMLKAFGTGADGAEWIPTGISTTFVEEFELEKRVAMAFREIGMPTNPWKLSKQNGTTTARISSENTAMTASSFPTDTIDFDAFKLAEFYVIPEELNEDSAPNILQLARAEVVEAQIRARETIILNGDDSPGAHQDSDTLAGGADLAEKAAKGLRKLGLDNSANGGDVNFTAAAITTANLDLMRNQMSKFGINVRDLTYIFGPTGYNQAVALPEVTTVEKFGGNATILTGTLAAFRGIPVMISEFVREDLNVSGVHDGITLDRTVCHLVNMKRYWVGMRRPIRTRVMMDLPDQDRWLLASYSRIDFKGHAQGVTETSTVVGRNIQV